MRGASFFSAILAAGSEGWVKLDATARRVDRQAVGRLGCRAMQDVYDLFFDVTSGLLEKSLERLDDFLRPAIMSGFLSDLLTAASPNMHALRLRMDTSTGILISLNPTVSQD